MIKSLGDFVIPAQAGIQLFKDALFPIHCADCGQEGEWWCQSCRQEPTNLAESACYRCGRSNLDGRVCFNCQKHGAIAGVMAFFNYKIPAVARLITDFKYHSVFEMSQLWQKIITEEIWRLDFLFTGPLTIMPVPLHPRRERERGFNQSLILAELIYSQLKNTGKECLLDSQNLCRTRFTAQQAKLDRRARQKNLRNAFCWNLDAVVPERILLVDDVITSGATAREC